MHRSLTISVAIAIGFVVTTSAVQPPTVYALGYDVKVGPSELFFDISSGSNLTITCEGNSELEWTLPETVSS